MLIALTQKNDNKVIYINSKMITAFDEANDGVGTRIVFNENFAYEVTESLEEVKQAAKECHGLFCKNS